MVFALQSVFDEFGRAAWSGGARHIGRGSLIPHANEHGSYARVRSLPGPEG
jgi:hypothetical protein